VLNEEEVKLRLEEVKKEHHSARHWCYAWQIGEEQTRYRVNDDGEPSGTAGQPIYGQIQSFGVTNILIVVVRYFGGVKLGVGGLISAYKATARETLQNGVIIKKTIDVHFQINFEYADMNKVMRIVKENKLKILTQKMEMNCEFVIPIRKKNAVKVEQQFFNLRCLTIKRLTG
jgi:uncharacterized YigZ family protein